MNTLYIDTHDKDLILAIYQNEKLLKIKKMENARELSIHCIPLLIDLFNSCNLTVKEIHDIVVVNGPGSFTGVRLGVTIAKTLAFTLNIPIRSITSLECFLPISDDFDFISIPEKNGYFIGKLKDHVITCYEYITKDEYQKLKENKQVFENGQICYDHLISFAHQKYPIHPHEVNPFYVKKIEVEK